MELIYSIFMISSNMASNPEECKKQNNTKKEMQVTKLMPYTCAHSDPSTLYKILRNLPPRSRAEPMHWRKIVRTTTQGRETKQVSDGERQTNKQNYI